ncbi:acetyltransferase [Mycolicibacterium litorale]|uniref:Acetyltransferase n=1 Tax=Mycolicibacterium litorale TaxID=758802 RepID=A0A6S6P8F7_9MYCO|nr:acetyltransferase [Mycolicibacterium litorale]
MDGEVLIRQTRGAAEYPVLVAVWRSAVVATHDFLEEEHRLAIEERLATDYLPNVRLAVAERDGVPIGFAGTASGKLEMLFVDADSRGKGVGSALLKHVIATHDVVSVDVNEQNEQAVGFYARAGFSVVGRSPVDGDGLPYPLLHMTSARERESAHLG